jgi:hypothetical protein
MGAEYVKSRSLHSCGVVDLEILYASSTSGDPTLTFRYLNEITVNHNTEKLHSLSQSSGTVISYTTASHHTFKMAVLLDAQSKQRAITEFLTAEAVKPSAIHNQLTD